MIAHLGSIKQIFLTCLWRRSLLHLVLDSISNADIDLLVLRDIIQGVIQIFRLVAVLNVSHSLSYVVQFLYSILLIIENIWRLTCSSLHEVTRIMNLTISLRLGLGIVMTQSVHTLNQTLMFVIFNYVNDLRSSALPHRNLHFLCTYCCSLFYLLRLRNTMNWVYVLFWQFL